MKWVYENQDEAKAMGARASKWVHENWTYNNTAVKLVEAIKKHYKGWRGALAFIPAWIIEKAALIAIDRCAFAACICAFAI